jgi:glycosyltransferase domain-containing protein
MSPEITVVVPTYNREELLLRAVRCVQNQTYPNVRLLICDNASSDGTQAAVAQLMRDDTRIEYHRHESNIGAMRNWLFGLAHVRTPYFLFLSDDDVILPHMLAEAQSWLERFPDAQFAAGGTLEATQQGKLVFSAQSYWPREGYFSAPDGIELLLAGLHPSWTTTLFRTSVLELVGLPNADLPNRLDLDFTLRIACRYPFVVFRKPSGIFVRHGEQDGVSMAASVVRQYEAMADYYGALEGLDGQTRRLVADGIRSHLSKCVWQVAVKQLLRGEAAQALETVRAYRRRGYRTSPMSVFLSSVALVGAVCPPALAVLRPLEKLRGAVQAHMSRAASRQNGIPITEIDEALAVLRRESLHPSV